MHHLLYQAVFFQHYLLLFFFPLPQLHCIYRNSLPLPPMLPDVGSSLAPSDRQLLLCLLSQPYHFNRAECRCWLSHWEWLREGICAWLGARAENSVSVHQCSAKSFLGIVTFPSRLLRARKGRYAKQERRWQMGATCAKNWPGKLTSTTCLSAGTQKVLLQKTNKGLWCCLVIVHIPTGKCCACRFSDRCFYSPTHVHL